MLYRKMPRIKEELSILGFGCMRLPTRNKEVGEIDEPTAARMMNTAIDNGVNYIDTARPYHGGKSEPFVGRALKGLRDKVQLATKLPSWLIAKKEDLDFHLNEQLEQLQTDHIDFYLLHALSSSRWENLLKFDVMDFMEKARAAGKIRYICFSFHDGIDTFKKIVDAYPWDMCQIQFNFLDEYYQAGTEGLKYARGKDIGVVVMEPLKGGTISIPVPEDCAATARAAGYAKPTLTDLGLRWVWNHAEVGLLLSGMSAPDQMDQNVESAAKGVCDALTPKELELVKAAKDLFASRVRVSCTACAYCMPCPKGVEIPQCFRNLNDAALSEKWEAQKVSYNYLLSDSRGGGKASACVECGACETQCPQHIPIREKLKEVVAAFETN
ncbi:MAG: aldo/keto reductase [Synergistaceae bacterium]|jgi:predicted aldo/keto reductase-like oxidoreductase|nr:aldo/keto reductase [Synergistaceae bacterium]